jgi:hypothetical protein
VAKARPKPITQLLLKDALARAVAEVHVRHHAQQLIIQWIASGQLPWSWKTWAGYFWRGMSLEDMVREFWIKPSRVRVDWEESCASVLITLGGARFVLYGVRVEPKALDKLLASLPGMATPKTARSPAKSKPVKWRGEVHRFVHNHMKNHFSEIFARDYVTRLYGNNPFQVSKDRLQNIVGYYRGEVRRLGKMPD